MFAKTIIDSDAFLDMSLSTQALYFHLSMRADDEGFVNNPKKIQRVIGANDDDIKMLVAKGFLIPFETGVVVIKHWKIHNYIQNDRFKPTVYTEEKAQLSTKENKAYTLGDTMYTECIQNGNTGKDSIDKNIYSANELFEKLWKLYPRKKGKSQISNSKKKELLKVGEDKLIKAIERYKKEVAGKDEQYVLMGSTFFNGRYQDYLDENYEKPDEHKLPTLEEWVKQ